MYMIYIKFSCSMLLATVIDAGAFTMNETWRQENFEKIFHKSFSLELRFDWLGSVDNSYKLNT